MLTCVLAHPVEAPAVADRHPKLDAGDIGVDVRLIGKVVGIDHSGAAGSAEASRTVPRLFGFISPGMVGSPCRASGLGTLGAFMPAENLNVRSLQRRIAPM